MPDELNWDPKAVVDEMTPTAFPPQEEAPLPAVTHPEGSIEARFGITPRAAATVALGVCSLYTAPEIDQLELAARGIYVDENELFDLIHRYYASPVKRP
jgi:hypothetical protein